MDRLSGVTLSQMRSSVEVPSYTRDSISCSIVHFGIGNFHRAHQAVYCDALLEGGEESWGIIGISLRSPKMRDDLTPQDFLYTQATLGDAERGGSTTYRIIGAIQNILVAPENPLSVIDAVARGETQLVTTTITEKGYCLSRGAVDRGHPSILQDIDSINQPQTIYGYLSAALIKRCADKGAPLTILCCDNMRAGGEQLRQGVQMLVERHSPESQDWIEANVAFSSSMVDRVTPATNLALIEGVSESIGFYDAAPVAAEPFTQWLIEDRFAGERPPFDRVGAIFVDDVAVYEQIKLRFLNAGHSMLAALGYLAGDQFIHETLQRSSFASFTELVLKCSVLPVTSVPENFSAEAYIDQVLDRFHNKNLPYAVLQVGSDSSEKIQQRWLPTIDDAIAEKRDVSGLAFVLATWISFISLALLNSDLNDPSRDAFARCKSGGVASDVQEFLALAGAEKFAFYKDDSFMALVSRYHRFIDDVGVVQAVDEFLTT